MNAEEFRLALLDYSESFQQTLSTPHGDWVVKGFIDVYHNVYTLSVDTKVISKIIELLLFPVLARFAQQHQLKMILSEQQNHYPDITFVTPDQTRFALDLKSAYRTGEQSVNGFTLGAFTGYFRSRQSTKNITFPYASYAAHFVLGTIYSRTELPSDERQVYPLSNLTAIPSVARQFQFVLHEKWRIASDQPGSGNTKNIGSVRDIGALVNGAGTFSAHGVGVFDDYWMNFLTADMARAIDSPVPFHGLTEYWNWRRRSS